MRYVLIVRDDPPRWPCVCFLPPKSEASKAFGIFLAKRKHAAFPLRMEVQFVRSYHGETFTGEVFMVLCRRWGINPKCAPPHSPKFNGVFGACVGRDHGRYARLAGSNDHGLLRRPKRRRVVSRGDRLCVPSYVIPLGNGQRLASRGVVDTCITHTCRVSRKCTVILGVKG